MSRNPIERALGVWSTANYRDVMLPGLGAVTCGQFCDAMADEALSRTGAVKVKALDLSNLLRHAFFEGFMIAGGSQEAAAEWWPEYDPETCPAYSRILSTLEPAPEAQQESVVVSVADINTWRAEWMDANDPQDGTDCVTPFDKYLYTRPTHGRRR